MRDGCEPLGARLAEDVGVRLGRELRLEPAEPDPGQAVLDRVADGLTGLLEREPTRDVGGERDLDAVQLLRLLGAVAEARVHLVPRHPAPHPLGGREDALDVDGAVGGGLGGVVDDDLAEVSLRLERVRRQDPDVDEVHEVGELVHGRKPLDGARRKRVVVPARDLEQRRRPHRPFQVDV